jgi:alkylation response protein AidB-like acyl-CoA dehydrogenase
MNLDKESRDILSAGAQDWFAEKGGVAHFRARRDSETTVNGQSSWREMAELGWAGLMVADDLGGSGLGCQEMGLLLEAAGRHMTPSPLLSTALIAVVALSAKPENTACRTLLEKIALGEITLALAVDETRHHSAAPRSSRAQQTAEGWRLSGVKQHVADAVNADFYLVSAKLEGTDGSGLFLVPRECASLEALSLIDCQDHGNLVFNDAALSAEAALAVGSEAQSVIDHLLDVARVGISAEMLGMAKAAFDMTIEYLKIREQFGEYIGSFQALQHRASTMYVELQLAEAVLASALTALDDGSSDTAAAASRAKALVGETLHLITNECIQMHGGIGMTDEHDAGLFLKRARVCESLYGSAAYHRDRFASLRGL